MIKFAKHMVLTVNQKGTGLDSFYTSLTQQ